MANVVGEATETGGGCKVSVRKDMAIVQEVVSLTRRHWALSKHPTMHSKLSPRPNCCPPASDQQLYSSRSSTGSCFCYAGQSAGWISDFAESISKIVCSASWKGFLM